MRLIFPQHLISATSFNHYEFSNKTENPKQDKKKKRKKLQGDEDEEACASSVPRSEKKKLQRDFYIL